MANRTFVEFPRASTTFQNIQGGTRRHKESAYAQLTMLLAVCLGIVQLLDALLTYKGLSLYGTGAEGNLLIASLCEVVGTTAALFLAKLFSIICIFIACNYGKDFRWMPLALSSLLVFYISFAIVPWSYLLI